MTVWMAASIGLAALLLLGGLVCMRGRVAQRLIGLQLASVITTLGFVTFGVAVDRPLYLDVGIVLAVTSFITGLVYARFAERWL